MKNLKLELKVVDFHGTHFEDNCDCAISKAIKRQLKAEEVCECVDNVTVDGKRFTHEFYGCDEFKEDRLKSESLLNDETVRIINLIKLS